MVSKLEKGRIYYDKSIQVVIRVDDITNRLYMASCMVIKDLCPEQEFIGRTLGYSSVDYDILFDVTDNDLAYIYYGIV